MELLTLSPLHPLKYSKYTRYMLHPQNLRESVSTDNLTCPCLQDSPPAPVTQALIQTQMDTEALLSQPFSFKFTSYFKHREGDPCSP